jgi:hypothetical protein
VWSLPPVFPTLIPSYVLSVPSRFARALKGKDRPPDPRDSQSRPVEAGTPAATAAMIAFCKAAVSFALMRGETLRGDSSARPWADQGRGGRRASGNVLALCARSLGGYCSFCMTCARHMSS